MLNIIDTFLDNITMYRLTLYELLSLLGISLIFSFFHILPFAPLQLLISVGVLFIVAYTGNKIFAYLFHAPTNFESFFISALILSLIITPAKTLNDFLFLCVAAFIMIASKFILAIRKKHLFNPAAIAVVVTALVLGDYASWWVGTASLLPFVVIGAVLVVRKIQRGIMVTTFLIISTLMTLLFALLHNVSVLHALQILYLDSSLIFFATVMLTEPLTTPATKMKRILYASLVGLLFFPQLHIGPVFSTPEIALVIGNIFSYLVSPKQKLMLTLKEKIISKDGIKQFLFTTPEKIAFIPGQYMEWTLPHPHTDSRGNRRYFTLASSPTEKDPLLGVRFFPNSSSYKKALSEMKIGDTIAAGSLNGEFVLPNDVKQKLVFVAGGIGITPFRSMVTYMIDTNQTRDIVLLYIAKNASEMCYEDIFEHAKPYGLRTLSVESSKKRITANDIQKDIPDFLSRIFYLSGSHAFVVAMENMLHELAIPHTHIKKDFFPGLA